MVRQTSFRLSESSQASLTQVEAEMPEESTKPGWRFGPVTCFIIVLAAIALSTGVGLIVHFAHPARHQKSVTCPTARPTQPPPTTPDADTLWQMCQKLARDRSTTLPGMSTTPLTSTTATTPATPATNAPPVVRSIRLPTDLTPVHYNVNLRPFIYSNNTEEFHFNGSVSMILTCVKATKVITLHSRNLETSNVMVTASPSGSPVKINKVWFEPKGVEFMHIELDVSLEEKQTYQVDMDFTGPLKKDLKGIYYSEYTMKGQKRYIMTSQLQTTSARKIFPCLDEPAFKATFNTTIQRMPHMNTMSNTIIYHSEVLPDGWIADHYTETPVMSPYILAFMVSDFVCNNSTTSNGKLVEICARPNALEQTTFANEISGPIQEFFEEYHNISYPLPKTIHAAVTDFAAGAMENWGLIIYRETALLYDPQVTTADQKQRVAKVIAHELAHQWFGNLVTTKWWDHIWLNEGFASYLENIGTDKVFPQWDVLTEMVVTKVQRVFGADSLATSRPIYQEVNNYIEISQVFDPITYSKGASVIRMMKHFLGEETFRWGLSNYLKDRAYSVATSCDVFRFLTQQARAAGQKIDVEAIMDTWVRQMGYPVVMFTLDKNTGSISLNQSHFLIDPRQTVERKSPYNYIWKVPISVATSKTSDWEKYETGWLNDPSGSIQITDGSVDWFLGNVHQRYYYRVNYDTDNWNALTKQLKTDHKKIPIGNRAQIIDDTMNLGRAGHVDQTLVLNVASYLDQERHLFPWISVSRAFGYMDKILSQTAYYGLFRKFMQSNIDNTHGTIGWTKGQNDTHLQQRLRTRITGLACHYGLKSCKVEATTRYQQWMQDDATNNTNSIDRNVRPVVYCHGIQEGGLAEWDFAFRKYQEVNTAAEQRSLLRALACTQKDWLVRRYLQEALDERVIRRQDFSIVTRNLATKPIAREITWQFFQDNWATIRQRFGESNSFRSMVVGITSYFSTQRELRQLESFMAEHPDQGTGTNSFKTAVETTKSNIAWRQTNEQKIKNWLQTNVQTAVKSL